MLARYGKKSHKIGAEGSRYPGTLPPGTTMWGTGELEVHLHTMSG